MLKLLNFLSFRGKVQVIEYLGGLSLLKKPSLNKTLIDEVHVTYATHFFLFPFPRFLVCFFLLIEPSYTLASEKDYGTPGRVLLLGSIYM